MEKAGVEQEGTFNAKLNEANAEIERLVFEIGTLRKQGEAVSPASPSEEDMAKLEAVRDELSLKLGEEVSARTRAQ
jgi:hypothetical protein